MKKTRNTFLKTLSSFIVIFTLVCTTNVNAQQGPPPGLDNTIDNDNSGVPLDGGLAILVIGAAALGIKRYRDIK
ncbi:hypothetical protein AAFN75_07380 [Algibacter sp. AS12]|uniref:PID-CTERM protein-sorting domain-containing protein n=1 Tax=Algibacter sp. AS12 TaxID=3135773 RepID=UPI00398B97F1